MSKTSGHKYYFTIGKDRKPRSEYFIPEEARLDMIHAFMSRVMWPWEPSACGILEGTTRDGVVSRLDMEEYITRNINKR